MEQNSSSEELSLLSEIGGTGLKIYGGTVAEEFLSKLDGTQGIRMYSEMRDNSDIIGAFLWAIKQIIRATQWRVEAENEQADMAELLSTCMDDMSHTWQDFLDEVISMIVFGWSIHEIVLKRRAGRKPDEDRSSRYDDNLIGIAKLPIRAQETLYRFITDPAQPERILGMEQMLPSDGTIRLIPYGKTIHFRPSAYKGNPLGRSMLRNAYVAYYYSKKIQEIEAIGLERELTGLPVITAPTRIFSPSASAEDKAILNHLRGILQSVRQDTHKGLLMPGSRDEKGNPIFELKLLSSAGSRAFDTDKIASRYDRKIATSVLADFLVLGHNAVGSFALSENKTSLFLTSIVALLDTIEQTLNRRLVPLLMEVNGWGSEKVFPVFRHGGAQDLDPRILVDVLGKLSAIGMPLFPDPVLEASIREKFNLPDPSADETKVMGSEDGADETGETKVPGEEKPNPEGEKEKPNPEDEKEKTP